MVNEFTSEEWKKIMDRLIQNPKKYGLPQKIYGTVLLASFNVRKLGKICNRTKETWEFLAYVCRHFDLISVQEIQEDLSGLYKLKHLMGSEYGVVLSDTTGVYPGERGAGERLGFIFRWSVIQRVDVVADLSCDRTKILKTLAENLKTITHDITPYIESLEEHGKWKEEGEEGEEPKIKKLRLSVFLDFIRAPYYVSFRIIGHPDAPPYEFIAVNAHLYYGERMRDRELEFEALMDWIIERVKRTDKTYFPNFILLGDLNMNFDDPVKDRKKITKRMKEFNSTAGETVYVNFPFIDIHPSQTKVFPTNARLDETFDQIGLFFQDKRFPTFEENKNMGKTPQGPDYGVFHFVNLFSDALFDKKFEEISDKDERKKFIARFEFEVSDHMPIWLRLSLP